MNCNKCNSILPDGVKFCPSCGTAVLVGAPSAPVFEAAPAQKFVCEKCGLEVPAGAKFCSVCGGAAKAQGAASAVGVGSMGSAVSLDKPTVSDGLVSAMNSAANSVPTPSVGVPTPSNSVPAPSAVPMPSNSGIAAPSSFASGASSFTNAAPAAPSAPAFAPSANAADMSGSPSNIGTLPNYNGGAATAEKPVKKKHKGTVAIVIVGLIAAILGTLAILFFTNRASVLSTIMGKSKYAAMVEGNHIKKITEQIDMPALAEGIKAGSGAVQMITAVNPDMSSLTRNFYSSGRVSSATAPMMYVGSYGNDMAIDLSSLEKVYAELLRETYGKNSVSGSLSANIQLGDSLKSIIEDELSYYYYYDFNQFDEILDYVNNTSLTYRVSAQDDAMAVSMGTEGKLTVNTKVLLNGQDIYISLPFVSDKAVKLTFDKPTDNDYSFDIDVKPLELDAEELERIVGDIIKIYLDHYKELEIEMEKGEITAAGVTASGKLITAEFSLKDLYELIVDVAEYLENDDYLAEKIVEFANNCGFDIDKSDYADAIEDLIDELDYDEDSKNKLIIETVINNSGEVLAKTYTAVNGGDKATLSFASTKEQSGIEAKAEDVKISLLNEKEDESNGSCTLKVTADGKTVSLALRYSDVKTAEFCGRELMTGTFDLTMKLPDDFKDMLDTDSFAALNGSKLTLSISANGSDSLETSVSVKSNGYIEATVTETVSVADNSSDLNVPSGAIDLTSMMKGEYLDDNTADEFAQLVKDVVTKLIDMGLPIDPDILDDIDPSDLTGKVSREDINEITEEIDYWLEYIQEEMEYCINNGYLEEYMTFNSAKNKLTELANRINAKNYSMTWDEYYEFYDEFLEIYWDLP